MMKKNTEFSKSFLGKYEW